MALRHKHADVIIAWANGEEVEYRAIPGVGEWYEVPPNAMTWCDVAEYRIKPKTVKREGWVNIYPDTESKMNSPCRMDGAYPYKTKEIADGQAGSGRIACIRIEWEEEQ